VDSKPGHGATFRILLPAIPAREQSETGALGAPAAASRKTVLVVEDEAGVRELMRDLLEANGYNVLAAGNGEDALRLCREHGCGIDLLLTDMVMPGMGGDELAGRMRQARPGLRVVFMSGHAVEAPAAYGGRPASDTFLQKPFSPAMLGETLREALG
jgi:CheY-like chemotaxis protein